MSWADKLESRLSSLTNVSSPESLAAVATWICFNRKHADTFGEVLGLRLPQRPALLLELLHTVLLSDADNAAKWDRGADLRRILGDVALLPNLKALAGSAELHEKLQGYVKAWDEANVFGGPSLLHQIRKVLREEAESKAQAPVTKDEHGEAVSDKSQSFEAKQARSLTPPPSAHLSIPADDVFQDDEQDIDLSPISKKPRRTSSLASASQAMTETSKYDFDATGIPFVKTDPAALVRPCSQVASFQIARDVQNDGAIKLNSWFTALPEDVRRSCAEAAETDGPYTLRDDETARDYSMRINESLIDLDLKEELQNLHKLRRIIEQQRQARQVLLQIMIESRCKFGSDDAAAAFYKADRGQEELTKRRQIILDAMELEGCGLDDEAEEQAQKLSQGQLLEPLTWYTPVPESGSNE